MLDSFIETALFDQCLTEISMRLCRIRIELQSFVKIGDGIG